MFRLGSPTYRVYTCVFAHPTSDILHPTSYIRHSTFDIRHSTFVSISPPIRCHPKKVATSDDEQAQQRPGQLRSSRQSPALSGHLPSHQVVALLTVSCMPKFLCQRNVAVGGERSGEHGNLADSASCGNGPLESNGIRNWRTSVEGISSGQRSNHLEFSKKLRRRIHVRFLFWYF